MDVSKLISYVMIVAGGCISIYANSKADQNDYLLIGGIVILMLGIYRISKQIPSKSEREPDNEKDLKE